MFPKDDTYQAWSPTSRAGSSSTSSTCAPSLNWDIKDDLRFVYSAGYEDQDRESAQDMEQSLNAWDQAMFFLPGTGSKSWSHEIQLQSYGNKKFNWIAGANYFHEKTSTIGYFDNAIDDKALWDQPDRSTRRVGALRAGNLLVLEPVAPDARLPLQRRDQGRQGRANVRLQQR